MVPAYSMLGKSVLQRCTSIPVVVRFPSGTLLIFNNDSCIFNARQECSATLYQHTSCCSLSVWDFAIFNNGSCIFNARQECSATLYQHTSCCSLSVWDFADF